MKNARFKPGFSIVEALVMMAVLALGLVTILLVLRSANINNANAHFISIASKLAQGKLEEIVADRKTRGFAYIDNSNYEEEDPVDGFVAYKRNVNIYFVDISDLDTEVEVSNYKRIDVTVESTRDLALGVTEPGCAYAMPPPPPPPPGGGGGSLSDFPNITVSTIVSNY